MNTTRHPGHTHCIVCGSKNRRGLNLTFHRSAEGWIHATLPGDESLQGYPRMMHGGIISLLLDGAMTHCLFSHGCAGVTARMEVKFRHPVRVDSPLAVRAKLVRSTPSAHQLKAELLQEDRVMATAMGLFVESPELVGQDNEACLSVPRE